MGTALSTLHNAIKALISALSLLKTLSDEFNQALKRASLSPGLPNPNPTPTYWLSDPPFPELVNVTSSKLPQTADVAIIGSGITGAAVARSLMHERRRRNTNAQERIVVLEARQLCSGATARNGGHIKVAPYEVFSRLSKCMPKDRAAALVRFQMRHLEALINLCQREDMEAAEARNVETVDLFLDAKTFHEAIESVNNMKEYVPEVEITIWDGLKAREV